VAVEVVVVEMVRTGSGGGGAETTCDSGWVAQPAKRPSALQKTKVVASRATVRTGIGPGTKVLFFIFMAEDYAPMGFKTMGCSTERNDQSTTDGPTDTGQKIEDEDENEDDLRALAGMRMRMSGAQPGKPQSAADFI